MTPFDRAVMLLRRNKPKRVQVDDTGTPNHWPYLDGVTDMLVAETGLPGMNDRIKYTLCLHVGVDVFTHIPRDERVLVCAAPACAHMAGFTWKGWPLCPFHIQGWEPEPIVCTCEVEQKISGRHLPACPAWSMADVRVDLLDQAES